MANIFEIGQHLKSLYNEIEDGGGELTPELEEELSITEDNFKDKIEAYCQVIAMYNSDIDCCKNEKDRINSIQKVRKNTLDRIKLKLLDAVKQFGITGKSGNKIIELPTRKLFTKSSTSVSEDELRAGKLTQLLVSYIRELQSQGILELGEEIDVNGLLTSINAIAKAEYEIPDEFGKTPLEEFIPYTLHDLQAVQINITHSSSLYDILTKNIKFGYVISENIFDITISSEVSKDVAKGILTADSDALTVGKLVSKESLTIK